MKSMEQSCYGGLDQRIRAELQAVPPGKIIGVECSSEAAQPWEQRLLEGTAEVAEQENEREEQTGGSSIEQKKESLSAAVFVGVIDQNCEGHHLKAIDSRWLVVCILADGIWTMVPISDVVAVSTEGGDMIQNVDLLKTRHSATFVVDPNLK